MGICLYSIIDSVVDVVLLIKTYYKKLVKKSFFLFFGIQKVSHLNGKHKRYNNETTIIKLLKTR